MRGNVTPVFKQKLIGMQMNCECIWQVQKNVEKYQNEGKVRKIK